MKNSKYKSISAGDLLGGTLKQIDNFIKKTKVRGVALDSRKVSKDYLFFALKGNVQDGNNFIEDALTRGASMILSDNEKQKHPKIIFVPDLRKLVGQISSIFFGEPSRKLRTFIVTGTNGKTSCVEMISRIGNLIGKRSGYISTIGVSFNGVDIERDSTLTTPDPVDLQKTFFDMTIAKTEQVAVEASSHGLDQSRLYGTKIDTAVLTSFSHDHLDYHSNLKEYSMAKKKLFTELNPEISILNIDNHLGREIFQELKRKDKKSKVFTISQNEEADFVYKFHRCTGESLMVNLNTPKGSEIFSLNTFSRALASNVISALAALQCSDYDLSKVYPLLKEVKFPEGRMELINLSPKDKCFIDFAHTPDALEASLLELNDTFRANIWCLFGCGGERDKAKRPLMGKIAEKFSDHLIITSDNPRSENEMEIINQIASGIQHKSSINKIVDREEAIRFCLNEITKSKQKNILLIAGKGHEKYQEKLGNRLPFSDRKIVNSFINSV